MDKLYFLNNTKSLNTQSNRNYTNRWSQATIIPTSPKDNCIVQCNLLLCILHKVWFFTYICVDSETFLTTSKKSVVTWTTDKKINLVNIELVALTFWLYCIFYLPHVFCVAGESETKLPPCVITNKLDLSCLALPCLTSIRFVTR